VNSALRILLVGNDPGDVRLIRESLADAGGFVLEQCGRLDDGFRLLGEERFDLLLLDLSLVDDRIKTLEQVRRLAPAIPVVVLTDVKDEALGIELLRTGAQDCLIKGTGTAGGQFVRALRCAVERKKLEEELLEANRKKDDFLSIVSHELRTPLTVILGRTQMLLEGTPDSEAVRKGLEAIYGSARVLTELVDDLLDISRIVSGRLHLTPRLVSVRDALQAALDRVSRNAEFKQVQIRASADQEAVIWADPARLQQVLSNLLANGVKCARQHGHVDVTVRRIDGQVEIRVADDGRGIAPELLPHVFDRLTAAKRSPGGLGLSLAIVKHLTEMHGGVVMADSKGEGQGAAFSIRLPSRPAADPQR
jgi:signal transduction histidine kinase